MAQFEVMYKVYDTSNGYREQTGPGEYTIVVEAAHNGFAAQMVQTINGGADKCHIVYSKQVNG